MNPIFDVAVIGAGPAGLAAALSSDKHGAKTLLIEREENPGGILKQCIHDGFGLVRFNEKLSGPEYAYRFIDLLPESKVELSLHTFVSKIEKSGEGFTLTLVNKNGVNKTECKSLVFACGCRERTSRQIQIHGMHQAGIITAGTAQYYTNILGKMPGKKCVILGSGDIGLIMARRLKLEGADVLGVYEAKSSPGGLMRNVYQCLEDFDIPLFTGKTVTRVFGEGRLSAVEITSVDENMTPVPGTEKIIECDTLVLSVGLIPENELAQSLNIPLDPRTKGPVTDQFNMTMEDGVFCCGNALHVNDLVDYVSESGEIAGKAAAQWANRISRGLNGLHGLSRINTDENGAALKHNTCKSVKSVAKINADSSLLYVVPQLLRLEQLTSPVIVYFRSSKEMGESRLSVTLDGNEVFVKKYQRLRPPEMERLEIDFAKMGIKNNSQIHFILKEML